MGVGAGVGLPETGGFERGIFIVGFGFDIGFVGGDWTIAGAYIDKTASTSS